MSFCLTFHKCIPHVWTKIWNYSWRRNISYNTTCRRCLWQWKRPPKVHNYNNIQHIYNINSWTVVNLVGPSGPSKKWPTMTTDLVPAGVTGKRPFLRFVEKRFFGLKSVLFKKKNQNLLRDWYLFGKRVLFCLHNFVWSWLKHVVQPEVNVFFGPKPRISERWSILHLRIDFPTFRFRGTAVFVKKKTGRHVKKSFPTPLWGNRLPVTTLALSVRRPFRAE